MASSAVTFYLFSELLGIDLPLAAYGTVLGLVSVIIILRGKYASVEWVTKIVFRLWLYT